MDINRWDLIGYVPIKTFYKWECDYIRTFFKYHYSNILVISASQVENFITQMIKELHRY